jgi:hypothetical protein
VCIHAYIFKSVLFLALTYEYNFIPNQILFCSCVFNWFKSTNKKIEGVALKQTDVKQSGTDVV